MAKFIKVLMQVAAYAFLAFSTSGVACAATLHIGPCQGQVSDVGYGKSGNGTISAAVVLPKSELARYAGARIKAVRIALVTVDGMSDLKCWLRNSLVSADVASVSVGTPTAGWNEVEIAGAGEVSGKEDIVVGYSFSQELTVKCMSVAGPSDANGYWIAKDGEWTDKSADNKGSLGIELVLEGDNLPEKNIAICNVSFDKITPYGELYKARFSVKNTESASIPGYVYECRVEDKIVASGVADHPLAAYQSEEISFDVQSDIVAKGVKIPVVVSVSADGDGYPVDNEATLYMSTYDDKNRRFFHNVLLEEFTTEHCGNCPRAINTIEQCMEQGYDKCVIQVTHHAGYSYDFLSTPGDKELEWFYGTNGTYAPAAMLDRLSDDQCKGALGGKDGTPVMNVLYANTFAPVLQYMSEIPAFVSVEPTVSYDMAQRRLDISVDIDKDDLFDALSYEPRLSLYILQDSILHHHQAGYSSDTFCHRHVYRDCVTPLFGDKIVWNGNSAHCEYSYVLPEYIESSLFAEEGYDSKVPVDPHDVEVVAFVSNYNPSDRCDCTVFNTGRCTLQDVPSSGISNASVDVKSRIEYYSVDGVRQSAAPSGISIMRMHYADGTQKNIKVVR